MRGVHFPLILFNGLTQLSIPGKKDKPSPAEKIKVHVIKEWMD